ncbi:MAG TPA: hypothetical protein VMF12_08340 [Xanthobacteraceae bacterium]|nr:hypothetical protein [Xanthobacteraceae bacterium]
MKVSESVDGKIVFYQIPPRSISPIIETDSCRAATSSSIAWFIGGQKSDPPIPGGERNLRPSAPICFSYIRRGRGGLKRQIIPAQSSKSGLGQILAAGTLGDSLRPCASLAPQQDATVLLLRIQN